MRNYQYRARDKKGHLVQGEVRAGDAKSARRQVASDGLIVLRVAEAQKIDFKKIWKEQSKKFREQVSVEDLIMFNRQMQIVYSVGIPIIAGMEMVRDQTTNPTLKKAIDEIIRDISEGAGLNEAMAKHEDIFDPVYINLVKVGEATGELQGMLERASNMIEQRAEQKAKIKSATFYPKMVLGFLSVVILIVVYVVLPKLKTFFTGFGAKLPWITRFVMGTSDFFVDYWYLFVAVSIGGFLGFKSLMKKPEFRFKVDELLLRAPGVGPLLLQIELSTFCVLLEILIKSGISIIEALTHVEESTKNSVVARDIQNCRRRIEAGESLAAGLKNAKSFPSIVKGLVSMGEEGGSLPKVLGQIASYYKIQIDHKLNNLSKMIEPLLLFFIFGIVLVLALAVFMPMWTMSSAIKK